MNVVVRVGPLPSSSAAAWVGYATSVLDTIQAGRTPVRPVPARLDAAFRSYLHEWAETAASGDTFEWTGEMTRDALAELATSWLELMAVVSGHVEELGLPVGPPAGEAFYHALVAAVGRSLDVDASTPERLGEKLQEAWPALGGMTGEHAGQAERRWRVVIADDSRDLRAVVRIALEQDGRFDVVGEAGDGREAAAKCAELQPDIVVLDLVMPRVDGWAALEMIREQSPSVTVIVVSTIDEAHAADRALALGAAAYVQKSISLATLTDKLAELAEAS